LADGFFRADLVWLAGKCRVQEFQALFLTPPFRRNQLRHIAEVEGEEVAQLTFR
jgi:hypothetical protein